MNNTDYKRLAFSISVKETIWDLLQQWKAMLIVAILMGLLTCGVKYAKDLRSFNDLNEVNETGVEADVTAQQKIDAIIANLPEDERPTVEFIVRQNKWIESEKEYINNSILMNTNATNQRTLLLDYFVKVEDPADSVVTSLIYGYAGYVNSEAVIDGLRQAIAPETESKYIAELITVNNGNGSNINLGNNQSTFVDEDAAVIEVRVVLPEEADAAKAESAVTEAFAAYSKELGDKIGQHSIRLIQSSEARLYNSDLVNDRNNIMNSIYNLQNNTKNMQTSLSDEQRAAIENITIIMKETVNADRVAEENETNAVPKATEVSKPGFSKKYALLGFMLGVLMYALIYAILIMVRGCINCASDAEYYTQNRLLGEIYYDHEVNGLAKLLHSRLVEKIRYKGKIDPETQTGKAVRTLEAVCEHAKANKIMLLDTTGNAGKLIETLLTEFENKGMDIKALSVRDEVEEKTLLSIENAVPIIGRNTEVLRLTELMSLCNDYDVETLGVIYASVK